MIDYNKEFGLEPLHYYCEVEQDFKIEEFRSIEDFKNYQVSDLGRVKSLERFVNNFFAGTRKIQSAILKSTEGSNGYLGVSMAGKDKKVKRLNVHRLVSASFLGLALSEKDDVINHKNFNRKLNTKNNLEITTIRRNSDRKHLLSSSQYTGVSWDKAVCKWRAQIYFKGKQIKIGRYVDEHEAHKAYETFLKEIEKL